MTDRGSEARREVVCFDTFRLWPARRTLLKGDVPIPVGARALDILIALLARPGQLVSSEDLFAAVWPHKTVEENTLRVQMAALRRALGDRHEGPPYITNVPGRGYLFAVSVTFIDPPSAPPVAPAVASTHNLPQMVAEVYGRADVIAAIADELAQRRLCTIIGSGGIGKTTVALGIAQRLLPAYRDGVRFLDLAPLSDAKLVPNALATVLGSQGAAEPSAPGLVSYLARKEMLLVFDNCEHVAGAVGILAEAIREGAPAVHVLATSREPLRVVGEHLHRLAALDVPTDPIALTADVALTFSAIQLFAARAAAFATGFALTDRNAGLADEVCRRLDGIALAIELAASYVGVYGLQDLAARLDHRFQLLTRGRRTALPRHQTLIATLDWSYGLLSPAERIIWRRLSIFAGGFTGEAATAVASGAEFSVLEIEACVASLVTKSLVVMDSGEPSERYRLLETMRAYASSKLAESGERPTIARQHAIYFRDLFNGKFEDGNADGATEPTLDRVEFYQAEINNVRAAHDWAFGTQGDTAIGIVLTAAYAPIWLYLTLIAECRERTERALAALRPQLGLPTRFELQLTITLGQILNVDRQQDASREAEVVLGKALALALSLNDLEAQLRVHWITQVHHFNKGDFPRALTMAKQFLAVATEIGDVFHIGAGHRLIGGVLLYAGDQPLACDHLRKAVTLNVRPSGRSHVMWGHYDQHVIAQTRLARALWVRGDLAEAEAIANAALAAARRSNHKLSICMALAEAVCFVAAMKGDYDAAESACTALADLADQYGFAFWKRVSDCLDAKLRICRGDKAAGASQLAPAIDALTSTGLWLYYPEFVGELAEGLGASSTPAKGLAVINAALMRTNNSSGAGWFTPDLLRIKGELLLAEGPDNPSRILAEGCFQEALDLAEAQGARFWQLRAALSIAQLRLQRGQQAEARAVLTPILGLFSNDGAAVDLQRARDIVGTWGARPLDRGEDSASGGGGRAVSGVRPVVSLRLCCNLLAWARGEG